MYNMQSGDFQQVNHLEVTDREKAAFTSKEVDYEIVQALVYSLSCQIHVIDDIYGSSSS